jgi:hypothetical protein
MMNCTKDFASACDDPSNDLEYDAPRLGALLPINAGTSYKYEQNAFHLLSTVEQQLSLIAKQCASESHAVFDFIQSPLLEQRNSTWLSNSSYNIQT